MAAARDVLLESGGTGEALTSLVEGNQEKWCEVGAHARRRFDYRIALRLDSVHAASSRNPYDAPYFIVTGLSNPN
jgi:hypothetical protein